MQDLLYRLGCWLQKRYCPHKNRVEVFRNYQEGYVVDKCLDCRKEIFSEI